MIRSADRNRSGTPSHQKCAGCLLYKEAVTYDVCGMDQRWLVPRKGFEPPTHALRMRCSTS
jgi:hypothetical protein